MIRPDSASRARRPRRRALPRHRRGGADPRRQPRAWRTPSSTRSPTPAPTRSSSRPTSPRPRARRPSRCASQFSRQDATRYDYWQRMEFTEDAVARAGGARRERGVLFLSSPFSVEAVDLLERIGQPLWKIASGEIVEHRAARSRARHRRAGAALDRHEPARRDRRRGGAGQGARDRRSACSSAPPPIPCPPEQIGLNLMPVYRERYGCWVGLSDHSATIYPGSRRRRARAWTCSRCTSRCRARCSGPTWSPR